MANFQIKFQERRIAERKKLTGLMPGKFRIGGKDASARPVDLSEHGLGILVAKEYAIGTPAELVIQDIVIPLEIKWSQPDFGKHDLWRYGLVCSDPKLNLIDIFSECGCFK